MPVATANKYKDVGYLSSKLKDDKRILMCGLHNAGKTMILNKLKPDRLNNIPHFQVNVEIIEHKRMSFEILEVNGPDKIFPLWRYYCENADAMVFVIDSSDHDSLPSANQKLRQFLDELRDSVVLLVLANKRDLPNPLTDEEIIVGLNLNGFKERNWHILGTCATSGDGLGDSLDWLESALS